MDLVSRDLHRHGPRRVREEHDLDERAEGRAEDVDERGKGAVPTREGSRATEEDAGDEAASEVTCGVENEGLRCECPDDSGGTVLSVSLRKGG